MPHLHCQVPLFGLANQPNSVPSWQAWVMVSSWSPKPSLKDTSNQESLAILIQYQLLQCHSILCNQDSSPQPANILVVAEWQEVPGLSPCPAHQLQGQDWDWRPWELWVAPSQSPSLLSDHSFERDRSSASTSSSVASVSERLGVSRHPHHGWWPHRETGGHVKINLLVFKDEDTKDAITYQSWCWDITVYCWAGCWDCTLLPYVIHSLQGYPSKLVRSSGTDVMLDDMVTILDELYTNIKALDALNQELFQLRVGEKEMVSDWGLCLSRHLQVLAA